MHANLGTKQKGGKWYESKSSRGYVSVRKKNVSRKSTLKNDNVYKKVD